MGWPTPGKRERVKPIERARRFAELTRAFHDSHFPHFEDGKLWSAFNSRLTIEERSTMVKRLCLRHGKDFDAVRRSLFGVSDDSFSGGSVWTRATYITRRGAACR